MQTAVTVPTGGRVAAVLVPLRRRVAAPEVARWVLVAGWLGHGAWDLAHLRRRVVVSRSYAEWCVTLDVLVALQLVLVP